MFVRSRAEQATFSQKAHRIWEQTGVSHAEKTRQLVDLGYGVNGFRLTVISYRYFIALDLSSLLAGLGLIGYGAVQIARYAQTRLHPPSP